MASRPIYGAATVPEECVIKPIDNSLLTYLNQLNNILTKLNTNKQKTVTIERLQLLNQEINIKQLSLKK